MGVFKEVSKLEGKHIFTTDLGDGEIELITRDISGSKFYVYYRSNLHGEIKIDAEEFLGKVVEAK